MQLGREIFYNLYTIWDAHSGTPYTHSRRSVASVRDAVSVVGASINTVFFLMMFGPTVRRRG